MYSLIKVSAPGWERFLETEDDVWNELRPYICHMCIEDYFCNYNEHPKTVDDLLITACGCEFVVEELVTDPC